MWSRRAAAALVLAACSTAPAPEPERPSMPFCGGTLEPELPPLEPEACPTESPLEVISGCPPSMRAQGPNDACVVHGELVSLRFDDASAHGDEARAAAKLGRDKYQSGFYREACEQFSFAFERTAHANYALALASCEKELGRSLTARDLFRAVVAAKPPPPEKFELLRQRAELALEELKDRIGSLTIDVERDDGELHSGGFELTLDGQRLSPELLSKPFEVDPGEHVARAWARCYEPSKVSVVVAAGEHRRVSVRLLRLRASQTEQLALDPAHQGDAGEHRAVEERD